MSSSSGLCTFTSHCCINKFSYERSRSCQRHQQHHWQQPAPACSFQQRVKHSVSPSCSNNTTTVRLQPIRATVPYQLLRGYQHSPTRSASSSITAESDTGLTTSRCSSPANPGGSGSEGRLVPRQTFTTAGQWELP